MIKKLLFLFSLVLFTGLVTFAQEAEEAPEQGWDIVLGFGADFGQLLQINPKVGAGANRIGIGGALSLSAKYKKDRLAVDNSASWNFAIQKIGSGKLPSGVDNAFEKSIDEFRLGSKVGYKTSETSKFFYALDFTFISQLTKTYAGNYLTDANQSGTGPLSRFFSPAFVTLSAGIDYKPDDYFSLFFSPFAYKAIVVADDNIAAMGDIEKGVSFHGNPWNSPTDFDNVLNNLGATLKAAYARKFLEEKLAFKSGITLYSNYLDHPERIDVEWTTETAYNIWKGLQISLLTNLFYDYDVLVQESDFGAIGGVTGEFIRGVSFTEQLLIKYNIVF